MLLLPLRASGIEGVVGCDAHGNNWRVEGHRSGIAEYGECGGDGEESRSDVSESDISSSEEEPSWFVEEEKASRVELLDWLASSAFTCFLTGCVGKYGREICEDSLARG